MDARQQPAAALLAGINALSNAAIRLRDPWIPGRDRPSEVFYGLGASLEAFLLAQGFERVADVWMRDNGGLWKGLAAFFHFRNWKRCIDGSMPLDFAFRDECMSTVTNA